MLATRALGLLLGWLCVFGRHTITHVLLALGLGEVDWTAFYHLFSRARVDYERLTSCLLGETLAVATPDGPYLVAVDATQIPRRSHTMPGTSWLRHPGTAIFRAGIHRAQRFVHLAWLPLPSPAGYSRAVPLCWEAAFPAKAVPAAGHPPRKEWEAGLAALEWARTTLDATGRPTQSGAAGSGQRWRSGAARSRLRTEWRDRSWSKAPTSDRCSCWWSRASISTRGANGVGSRRSGWSLRCPTRRVAGACPGP